MAVSACQTTSGGSSSQPQKVVSLEEAKAITSQFKTTSYVPPDRSIDDIRRVLRSPRELPENCADVQSERRQELISYLRRVGDYGVRVDQKSGAIRGLVEREIQRGQYEDMKEMLDQAIQTSISGNEYYDRTVIARADYQLVLAQVLYETGDTDRAVSLLNAAEADLGSAFSTYDSGIMAAIKYGAVKALTPLVVAYRNRIEGNYDLAEANLRTAVKNRFFLNHTLSFSKMQSEIGHNLLQQGRIAEAEYEIRQAWHSEYTILEYTPHRLFSTDLALPTRQLAEIFLLQNRLDDAKYLSEIAVNMYEVDCAAADSVGLARAIHTLAQIQAAQSDWNGILSKFQEMRQKLKSEAFDRLYANNLEWLMAQAKTGSAETAIDRLQTIVAGMADRAGEHEYAEYLAALAFAQHNAKDYQSARQNFAKAIPVILEGQAGGGASVREKVKSVRQHLILSGYMDALMHGVETASSESGAGEAMAELFRIANVSQLGRVQWAVSAASARNAIDDPALADLMRREQDAARESEAILNVLSNLQLAPADQVRKENIVTLQARFSALNGSRQTIMREISSRFPAYANLINPSPATLGDTVEALRPGESVVVFHVGEKETLVWAIPQTGKVAFARLDVPADLLTGWVESLRGALDPQASTLGAIPVFNTALSHTMFKTLLEPVRDGWQGSERILLVPHGALGQLPFGLLVTESFERPELRDGESLFSNYRNVPWLIRKVAIERYPSVNAFIALRNSPGNATQGQPLAGFADPQFRENDGRESASPGNGPTTQLASRGVRKSGIRDAKLRRRSAPDTRALSSAQLSRLPRLPDTSDEVKGIARALQADIAQSVFTGIQANEKTVKTLSLADRRVIVFATHGLVPGDLDGLAQPALALTAPSIANVEGDGLLTMSEILNLKLNADWVVLSACNTGAGDGDGAEAVSGLGRAFFYAGARALLVSNWPVETTSATALTTTLFEIQQGAEQPSRSEALRQAMLRLIEEGGQRDDNGGLLFSYAHPIFWAPFTLVGDGGNVPHIN